MIRRADQRRAQIRNQVRGGKGDAVFAHVWESGKEELNDNMRLYAVITLKAGDSIGYHVHEGEDELYFILSGKALYDDNGVKENLFPGDSSITRSGEGHGIESAGPEDLVLLAVIVKNK
ncbi:MAG: cupin domain-containing protein [Lentisphaeria bacterium]|nr:cupin domain-containing protein [Lentisphaeria bacterium]